MLLIDKAAACNLWYIAKDQYHLKQLRSIVYMIRACTWQHLSALREFFCVGSPLQD